MEGGFWKKEGFRNEMEWELPIPELVIDRCQGCLGPPVGNSVGYSLDNGREMQGEEVEGDPQCLGWSATNAEGTLNCIRVTLVVIPILT